MVQIALIAIGYGAGLTLSAKANNVHDQPRDPRCGRRRAGLGYSSMRLPLQPAMPAAFLHGHPTRLNCAVRVSHNCERTCAEHNAGEGS